MVNDMLNNLGAAIADEQKNVLKECKCHFFMPVHTLDCVKT